MRRFINSIFGKAVGQVVVAALILPFLQFVSASRVEAQLQTLPTWAVVEFVNRHPKGMGNLGAVAAEAVGNELARSGKIDIVPMATITRTLESLQLQAPVTDKTSLLRLAAEVRASTIVQGEVLNWQVRTESGGKKADVIVRVEVIDVASGLPINGFALAASSSTRAASAEDSAVVSEAISMAAAKGVAEINGRTLPTATILNTYEETALINQGTRTGFTKGQQLVVVRNREQVATASVIEVEPDSATIRGERIVRGMQPGDRVRVVHQVPTILDVFTSQNTAKIVKPRERGSNSGFTTLLLVLGVVGVLMSQGRSGGGFSAAHDVKAEPTMFPNSSGIPAVQVSWSRDLFARGNSQTVQWQIYRSDVLGSPVLVASGEQGSAIDTTDARDVTYGDFGSVVGGNVCTNTTIPEQSVTGVVGVTPGRPYNYSVALVYRLAAIDLPDGGNASTGTGGTLGTNTGGTLGTNTGGTLGTNTGGTNTGGTNTGTNTAGTGAQDCFFISKRAAAQGIATPLNPPGLLSPSSNQVVSTDLPFTFTSVVNPTFPTIIKYSLQVSTDPQFPKSRTKTYAEFTRGDVGTLSTGSISNLLAKLASDFGSGQQEFFWRVGARNTADKPGPVDQGNGQRYIFSPARRFTIPSPPPPPPLD